MIKNDKDEVALVHIYSHQRLVEYPKGRSYVFVSQRGVALAWVAEADVEKVLGVRDPTRCCGGNKKPLFRIASQQEVNIWSGT